MKKSLLILALAAIPFVSKAGDGTTVETAYTVKEVRDANVMSFKGNMWVKGYIVGSFPVAFISQTDKPTFGTENATDHGLAIADDPKCTDSEATVNLINIQGTVKTNLNLKDNPTALGKLVAFKGMLCTALNVLQQANDYKELESGSQSGIDDIATDNIAPAVYYTLQGVSVKEENLTKGQVYVRVQGNKAEKLIVL